MDNDKVARRWFLAALSYFLLGTLLGVYLGASGRHELASVHSHAALLGWASMGLTGVLYRAFPGAARSRLAIWHFLLYQIGVPLMLLAVAALHLGSRGAEPVAGVASMMILAAVAMFAWAIFSARDAVPARDAIPARGGGLRA